VLVLVGAGYVIFSVLEVVLTTWLA
jgi:hypothetical protein